MINLFTACLLGAIVLNLLLGLFVLLTNVRRPPNRMFAILSACGALWLVCMFLGSTTRSEGLVIFCIRQSSAVSVFIPLFFYMLRNAVLSMDGIGRALWKPWPWTLTALALAGLCQSRFFLAGARLAAPGDLAEPIYGRGFMIFLAYWLAAVVFLVWSFHRALGTARGVPRVELQFMWLGSFLCLVPGVFIVLLIPAWTHSVQSARYAPLAGVVWSGVIAYGMVTRRIMNISEFLGRMLAYVLLAVLLAGVYAFVFRGATFVLPALHISAAFPPHILAAIVMALCMEPLRAFLQQRAGRLFSGRQDRLAYLVRQTGMLAQSVTTVDALTKRFAQLLGETLVPEHLRIYLREGGGYRLRLRSGDAAAPLTCPEGSPLEIMMRGAGHPVARDVLNRFGRSAEDARDERILAEADAEAAVALRDKSGLAGFILLGRISGGHTYGARETELLAVLGNQLGVALENAHLYTSLQDAKRYDEALLDHLVTGVLAVDLNGCLTVCNREALRILGLPPGGVALGRPAGESIPAPLAEALRAPLAREVSGREIEMTLPVARAEERTVRFAAARFASHEGAPSGALLVLQDVTALRRLEALVRRNDRLVSLGTVAAGMAHEIKNPLVCLKTFAQLLPERYGDPEFRDVFSTLVLQEVGRIDALVSQLLNLARPAKPELVPTSLHDLLGESLQLIRQPLRAKGLSLVKNMAADRDRVRGDPRLLTQIFINLFLNAMDAMSAEGTLTVATERITAPGVFWTGQTAADWIEVQVRDTGHGIPSADLARIFDPFFTTKANGTGLGLSVVHGIVSEHQGLVEVESLPGQGACFRVMLPLLPDDGDGAGEAGENV